MTFYRSFLCQDSNFSMWRKSLTQPKVGEWKDCIEISAPLLRSGWSLLQVTELLCASVLSSELYPTLFSWGHIFPKHAPMASLQHLSHSIHLQWEWHVVKAYWGENWTHSIQLHTLPPETERSTERPSAAAPPRPWTPLGSGDQLKKLPLHLGPACSSPKSGVHSLEALLALIVTYISYLSISTMKMISWPPSLLFYFPNCSEFRLRGAMLFRGLSQVSPPICRLEIRLVWRVNEAASETTYHKVPFRVRFHKKLAGSESCILLLNCSPPRQQASQPQGSPDSTLAWHLPSHMLPLGTIRVAKSDLCSIS